MTRESPMIRLPLLVCLFSLSLPSQARQHDIYNLSRPHVPGQLIVQWHPQFQKSARVTTLKSINARSLTSLLKGRADVVEISDAKSSARLRSAADTLAAFPGVISVETNQWLAIAATPNDPKFGELYGLHNNGRDSGRAGADINAVEAWDISTGSRDVVVGVIDSGIDFSHPDLSLNAWSNPGEVGRDDEGNDKKTNGRDDDGNGYVDDWRGWDFVNNDNDPTDDHNHGTHCAGTIGAVGNNRVGVVGVNWQVSMVGLKFLSASGHGELAHAVAAVEYATQIGATLTSNSWGGGGYSPVLEQAIKDAGEAGILFVAAAGNSAVDNDMLPHYPSSYELENVLTVAATDNRDELAGFSNYGKVSVDIAAPGVDILSTVTDGGYETFSGTSMAAPHVAGIAALIKAVYPEATLNQVRTRILDTIDPVATLTGKIASGGRANALNALEDDRILPGQATQLSMVRAGATQALLSWRAAGDDGDIGIASRYQLRVSSSPIDSLDQWQDARPVVARIESISDGIVLAKIEDLAFNTSGFFAVRAVDNVGNVGPLSSSAAFAVTRVRLIVEHQANSMSGITSDPPWGFEPGWDGQSFSDSPGTTYSDNIEASLTLRRISGINGSLTIEFMTKFEIETGYDFGFVEISRNGGSSWQELDILTGTRDWARRRYEVEASGEIDLRFRFTSDRSIARDGWLIDNIALYTPE